MVVMLNLLVADSLLRFSEGPVRRGLKTAGSTKAMKLSCLALLLIVGCSAKPDHSNWVRHGAALQYLDSSGRNWATVLHEGTRFRVEERCSDPPTTSIFDFEVYARNYAQGLCLGNLQFKRDKE
jgi:hypothetical protein